MIEGDSPDALAGEGATAAILRLRCWSRTRLTMLIFRELLTQFQDAGCLRMRGGVCSIEGRPVYIE